MLFVSFLEYLFLGCIALITCFIVHEGGHYITSVIYGHPIKFRFSFGLLFNKILIPRYVWFMPVEFNDTERKIVAAMGFISEIVFGAILLLLFNSHFSTIYAIISLLHLGLYNFYAGDNSDFKFFN